MPSNKTKGPDNQPTMNYFDESIVAQIMAYDPGTWLKEHMPDVWTAYDANLRELMDARAAMEAASSRREQNDASAAIHNAELTLWDYVERYADPGFVQTFGGHEPELLEAARRIGAAVVVERRNHFLEIAHAEGVTEDEAKTWAFLPYYRTVHNPDAPQPRTIPELEYGETFSDTALRGRIGGELITIGGALKSTALLDEIIDGLIAQKWTIKEGEPQTEEPDDREIPFAEGYTPEQKYLPIPAPRNERLVVMTSKLSRALTGVSERESLVLLAARVPAPLDEGIGKGRNKVETIISTSDENWRPMLATDVWPYMRFITMVDTAARLYGPHIFPLLVPIQTCIRWIYGSNCNVNDTSVQNLSDLLARLRATVSIDWDALQERMGGELAKKAVELGFPVGDDPASFRFRQKEAPLLNTSWGEVAQINRNGKTAECVCIYDWPMAYVYSIATGYLQRIPDDLLTIAGRKIIRETPEMLAVKAYLVEQIVTMYRGTKNRRINMQKLYEYMGATERKSRARVREMCERYLTSWATPRQVNGSQTKFIEGANFAPDKSAICIALVRGGLRKVIHPDDRKIALT